MLVRSIVAGTEPVVRRGKEVARVTGVSYPKERVTENLAVSMKSEAGSTYSVALLHANVGGQTGHADYAPATLDELTSSGFDYWALGHVHTRLVLATAPSTVVYPGNPQGRNARESGPRGCYQVDVDRNGNAHLQFIDTSLVRWTHSGTDRLIHRGGVRCPESRIRTRVASPRERSA